MEAPPGISIPSSNEQYSRRSVSTFCPPFFFPTTTRSHFLGCAVGSRRSCALPIRRRPRSSVRLCSGSAADSEAVQGGSAIDRGSSTDAATDAAADDAASVGDAASVVIPSTPCFTRHMTASPMPRGDRAPYIAAAVDAAVRFCDDFGAARDAGEPALRNVCNVTMMLPQLNPELDIFDRRFVLELVWALVNGLAFESGLKTRVLVQGVGKYGAVPLSVAGLRQTFEADMMQSRELWGGEEAMASVLGVAELENPAGVADDDEAVIVVTPCNASGMPVVQDAMEMAARVGPDRPILMINPRLRDVPSAAGVMGVAGRGGRSEFLANVSYPFYLRLLYDTATMFPLRGILYRAHPSPWQLWRPDGGEKGEGDRGMHALDSFRLIQEFPDMPTGDEISDAMAVDRRNQRLSASEGRSVGVDTILAENSLVVLVGLAAAAVAAGSVVLKGAIGAG